MNGYVENQTSGIDWSVIPVKMAHEYTQGVPPSEHRHGTEILQDFEKQMALFNIEHDKTVTEVCGQYLFLDDSDVRQFLRNHRTIPDFLLQAAPYLKVSFGANAVIGLRAPVDEGGYQTLYAIVMWPGRAKDAREALNQFDDAWWINNRVRTAGYLTFTYELV
jgi:hypothetical protein